MDTIQSIEAVGVTVEDAIGRGLDALNARRDQVSVDVIEPGGGKTMARVRVTLLPRDEVPETEVEEHDEVVASAGPANPDEMRAAKEVLSKLLGYLHIKAQVELSQAEAEDELDREAPGGPPIILNIVGDDLGVLIGRRGETLRDLQQITRMIASKQVGRQINVVVDVEGYKSRRERSLRQLADRMAERVASTHKPIALEPMPANERRIIHLALRNHPSVTTQSVGFGENRKVTLVPKSPARKKS